MEALDRRQGESLFGARRGDRPAGDAGAGESRVAAAAQPSRLAAVRGFGVMLGGSIALAGGAVAAAAASARALAAGRRPSALASGGVAATALYAAVVRPRVLRWGSRPEERVLKLPGDELVPDAALQTTRAVTVDAPVTEVWPWLAQIGQDRGGFYSYSRLENLAGCRMRNADEIHPEWQHRAVGEQVLLHPAFGLEVRLFEPGRALALAGGWAFAVLPQDGRTRLLARGRVPRGLGSVAYSVLLELPHFIMERRMLLGMKTRAERAAGSRG